MRGYNHALSGAAGWLALTSTSSLALGLTPFSAEVTLAGAVLCAGAALVPDIDHRQGTIAHSLPPLTTLAAAAVEEVSGGHRHATHSLLGLAVFTALAQASTLWMMDIASRTVAVGAGLLAVLLVAFASKALGLSSLLAPRGLTGSVMRSAIGPWMVSLLTAGAVTWFLDYRWDWLPYCMALGVALHLVGDSLTKEGVPWLWPLNPKPPLWLLRVPIVGAGVRRIWHPNGYMGLPVLGRTDRPEDRGKLTRETVLGFVLALYSLYLIAHTALPYLHQTDVLP